MYLCYLLLGSIFASWICCCAARYDHQTHEIYSICPHCFHRLSFHQMIPVYSWIKLKGRCAWCHAKIPSETIISELAGAIGFLVISMLFAGLKQIGMLLVFCALLYASLCDYLYGLIPDRTHGIIIVSALLILPASMRLQQFLFSLALLVLLFFIASWTQSIGMGDGKLISALALIMTPYSLLCMMSLASSLALIVSFIKKEFKRNQVIRFGPYLSFAAMVCLCFLEIHP